jgi:hypothetical protein
MLWLGPSESRLLTLPEMLKRGRQGWATWVLGQWGTLSAQERSRAVDVRLNSSHLLVEHLAFGMVAR